MVFGTMLHKRIPKAPGSEIMVDDNTLVNKGSFATQSTNEHRFPPNLFSIREGAHAKQHSQKGDLESGNSVYNPHHAEKSFLSQADMNNLQQASFMMQTAAAAGKEFRPKESLILGAERTFFAAMNNAWLIVFGGIGLLTVSQNNRTANNTGRFVVVVGIFAFLLALFMHVQRMWHLKYNRPFQYYHTVLWAGFLTFVTILALGFELYFAISNPYLDRGVAVVIQNEDTAN